MKTSDLRKGNLIKTEYGILPVHAIVFDSVQVKGKDGRILWAKEIEGLPISYQILTNNDFTYTEHGTFGNYEASPFAYECCFELDEDSNGFWFWTHLASATYLKYIHELQNLYYWLTGKDIEFSIEINPEKVKEPVYEQFDDGDLPF